MKGEREKKNHPFPGIMDVYVCALYLVVWYVWCVVLGETAIDPVWSCGLGTNTLCIFCGEAAENSFVCASFANTTRVNGFKSINSLDAFMWC